MKTRKPAPLILLLGTILALALSVRAEATRNAGKPAGEAGLAAGPGDRLRQFRDELNLTQDQKDKLKPLLQEERHKMRELRENKDLSRQERLGKLKEMRD